MQNEYFCYAMFRRFIILLLTVLLSYACSCGPKKQHKEIITETVSKEQVITEDFNKIGEKLQEFLSTGKPLKGWPFKEWGWRLVDNQMVFKMPKGETISGEVLREFLNLDKDFTLTKEDLSYYNHDLQWVCEPGDFEIMVSPNSRDTKGKTVRVTE